ncbi:MAG: hypothetical protein ACFFED_04405 [Candidatus Thorarchaeota archaeon]
MKRVLNSKSRRPTRVLITTVVAVMFIALVITPTACARPTSQTLMPVYYYDYMQVWIYDAYYGDLDQGGCDNDIHVILLFDLGYYSFYEVYYDITLTMPSGARFTYTIYFLADYEYIRIDNEFLNYATESGDYRIDITALMITPSFIFDTSSCIFDPPGSSEGGDPTFRVY